MRQYAFHIFLHSKTNKIIIKTLVFTKGYTELKFEPPGSSPSFELQLFLFRLHFLSGLHNYSQSTLVCLPWKWSTSWIWSNLHINLWIEIPCDCSFIAFSALSWFLFLPLLIGLAKSYGFHQHYKDPAISCNGLKSTG